MATIMMVTSAENVGWREVYVAGTLERKWNTVLWMS